MAKMSNIKNDMANNRIYLLLYSYAIFGLMSLFPFVIETQSGIIHNMAVIVILGPASYLRLAVYDIGRILKYPGIQDEILVVFIYLIAWVAVIFILYAIVQGKRKESKTACVFLLVAVWIVSAMFNLYYYGIASF